MKAKQLMDQDFVYVNKDDSVVDVSKAMEEVRRLEQPQDSLSKSTKE